MDKYKLESYLQKNPFEQIKNVVFELISDEIMTLRLKPGDNLNISKIAEDFNISITPVREAVVKLIDYGFIKRYKNKKGYYVAQFDVADIIKVFFARKSIESKTAYLCAQYKNCPNIERLEELAEEYKNSYCNYDIVVPIEYEFHKLLVLSCGNQYLMQFYNIIEKKIIRYIKYNLINMQEDYFTKRPDAESFATQHLSIINAIKQNMPELAEKEMITHIETDVCNALYFYNIIQNKIQNGI